jgi:hypothetical protein
MKTLKLNKNQVEALTKCLEHKIELYDTWIENIKNSLCNKSNSNLVFEPTNKYEQEAIEELKRYTETREQLNLILNQL